MALPTLYAPHAAARFVGVNERTLRKAVTAGRLTNHGTPRRILIDVYAALDLFNRADTAA